MQTRAMIATLLEHFHLSIDQIARLTDSQITRLYFHKRDKDGRIKSDTFDNPLYKPASDEKPSLESALRDLSILASVVGMSPAALEQAQEQARAKYADG